MDPEFLSVPGIITRYPHAGACPACASQNKISINLLVSYNLAGDVNLSFCGIASNRIGLVGTCRVAPCYNCPSRCHRSPLRSNRCIVDWRKNIQHVRPELVVFPDPEQWGFPSGSLQVPCKEMGGPRIPPGFHSKPLPLLEHGLDNGRH